MGDQGSDAIKIWIGIVLTLFLVGIVFGVVMIARQGTNQAATKISNTTTSLAEGDFTGYNGSIINGDQLIGVIKQFEGQDCVISVDGVNYIYNASVDYTNAKAKLTAKITTVTEAQMLANAANKTSGTYISPSSKYMGVVLRDGDTNAITGIYFKKQ